MTLDLEEGKFCRLRSSNQTLFSYFQPIDVTKPKKKKLEILFFLKLRPPSQLSFLKLSFTPTLFCVKYISYEDPVTEIRKF